MKYADGREVHVGDRVRLGADDEGVVVFSIDAGEYSAGYPQAEWEYLQRGVMINFETYGLIHYEESSPDLELLARKPMEK